MTQPPRDDSPTSATPTGSTKPDGDNGAEVMAEQVDDDERATLPNIDPDKIAEISKKAAADITDAAPDSGDSEGGNGEGETADTSSPPAASAKERRAVPEIRLALYGRTDVGQIREHNEDNFLVADLSGKMRGVTSEDQTMRLGPGGVLLAVCDGMGGAAAGEVASQLATDIIYQKMAGAAGHQDRDQLALDIVEALENAGMRILEEANMNRACRGMGTTATVAALVDDHLLLGQVGDSRAYILRGGRLVQVTRDQSLVNQLIEAGQLTEEEAENFEHSNIILQALGTADAVQVDLTYAQLRQGDVLMMCSDGLSGMIRDSEICDTLVHVTEPAEACRVLIDDANQAGGHDNITVIVAVFDGEGLKPASPEDIDSLHYQKYTLPTWVDDRAGSTRRLASQGTAGYDDTPLIEITGEFEVDPNTDWSDLFEDRPSIPRQAGPAVSNVVIWVAVAVLVFALYYLLARP